MKFGFFCMKISWLKIADNLNRISLILIRLCFGENNLKIFFDSLVFNTVIVEIFC